MRTHFIVIGLLLASTAAGGGFGIGQNFTAVDRGEIHALFNNNFTRSPAPDVNGGVGPNHVVLLIKGVYQVYDKTTGAKVQQLNDVSFWNQSFTNNGLTYQTTQTAGPSDPRILFDPQTNRWYAVGIDRTNSTNGLLNIAVTNGPDPTAPGAWRGFTYQPAPGIGWPDFPTVGINDDGLMISSAIFGAGSGYRGSVIAQFPRAALTAASPSAAGAQAANIAAFIANPTVSRQPAAGPMTVLAPSGTGPGGNEMAVPYVLRQGFTGIGGSYLAAQPGAFPVNVVGDRVTSSVLLHNNEIWGAGDARGVISWFRLNAFTGATIEQGFIEHPELQLYFPSLAIDDNNNVVIGMNGSSSSQFISSLAVAGRVEPTGTVFGDLTMLKEGVDSYALFDGSGRNRWGDYSTTVADPTVPNTFWTFQEIVAADRIDPQFGFVDNNRAIQITQIVIPEPAGLVLIAGLLMLRRWNW